MTGERTKVRVVRFRGILGAVVELGRRPGIEVGVDILVRGCGDVAGFRISIVR